MLGGCHRHSRDCLGILCHLGSAQLSLGRETEAAKAKGSLADCSAPRMRDDVQVSCFSSCQSCWLVFLFSWAFFGYCCWSERVSFYKLGWPGFTITIKSRLVLNSWQPSCLNFLNPDISV